MHVEVIYLMSGLCWQVFINACVTQAIVHYSESRQLYYVTDEHCTVLCDTQIVMKLLLSWRVWESAADSVWLLALNALNSLVQAGHIHQQYNIDQLCEVGVIPKMLGIWKVCRNRMALMQILLFTFSVS